jgi:DNA-binding response OmpR family regulator
MILYLEDEESLGSITYDMLIKNGFSVLWITNGADGLAAFNKQSFELCIVDIMMPGLDGYSFVKNVRLKDEKIPIIFLSARILAEDVVKGFALGGNDYLKKPFSVEELIARMNALLKRKAQEQTDEQVFTIGEYTFNYTQMELSIKGKKMQLSDRTNELLYRLTKHKNNVLNRRQTLIDLWGDDHFFNARSMDVFITKIRKYLSEDANVSIVNVRGIGYKLLVYEG